MRVKNFSRKIFRILLRYSLMKIDDMSNELGAVLATLDLEPKPGDLVTLCHRHLKLSDGHHLDGLLIDISSTGKGMHWVVLVDGIPGLQYLNNHTWKCMKRSA